MAEYYLAVDIGASSGRHILGTVKDGTISLEEIYRFENGMEKRNGHLCWDVESLFHEIKMGMKQCAALGKIPCSMGIDTWAVDFVLLDRDGRRLGDAVGYRMTGRRAWTKRYTKSFLRRPCMKGLESRSRYSTPSIS